MNRSPLVTIIVLLGLGSDVNAAGFQLNEHSVVGLGRAFAGYGVVGDDTSGIFYNPASMTLLEGTQIQVGTTIISTSGSFKNTGSSQTLTLGGQPPLQLTMPTTGRNDNGGATGVVPNFFAAKVLNDRVMFGLSITAPFGLKTEYGKDWVGRYHALESELKTIDVNPAASYRVSDKLSIGGGISAQYADVTLSRAVFVLNPATGQQLPDGFVEVEGDDWGYGWNLGLMYSPGPSLRFGLSYRSKVTQDFAGQRRLTGVPGARPSAGVRASTDLPETVYFGTHVVLDARWSLTAGARWTRWSRFDELRLSFTDGSPDDVTPEQWENSWTLSAGVNYSFNTRWGFHLGLSIDESPIPSANFRTPRIPDADRRWLAFGVTYQPSPAWLVNFGYSHVFVDDARLNNTIDLLPSDVAPPGTFTDTLVGVFDSSDADLAGVQFVYRFGNAD